VFKLREVKPADQVKRLINKGRIIKALQFADESKHSITATIDAEFNFYFRIATRLLDHDMLDFYGNSLTHQKEGDFLLDYVFRAIRKNHVHEAAKILKKVVFLHKNELADRKIRASIAQARIAYLYKDYKQAIKIHYEVIIALTRFYQDHDYEAWNFSNLFYLLKSKTAIGVGYTERQELVNKIIDNIKLNGPCWAKRLRVQIISLGKVSNFIDNLFARVFNW
jgi:hypothetical protein